MRSEMKASIPFRIWKVFFFHCLIYNAQHSKRNQVEEKQTRWLLCAWWGVSVYVCVSALLCWQLSMTEWRKPVGSCQRLCKELDRAQHYEQINNSSSHHTDRVNIFSFQKYFCNKTKAYKAHVCSQDSYTKHIFLYTWSTRKHHRHWNVWQACSKQCSSIIMCICLFFYMNFPSSNGDQLSGDRVFSKQIPTAVRSSCRETTA